MGLRVNTNIASMTSQRNLGAVTDRLQGNYSRLSSGLRIATAADDAAGLGISERMRSQIRSLAQNARNALDGISLAQSAEGALNETSNTLVRMRELAIQASNGTLSAADRATIDSEFQALKEEIDRIAAETEFNGIALLDGSTTTVEIQVGLDSGDVITIDLQDVTTTTMGISTTGVTTVTAASDSLALIDNAITTLNTTRGDMGAAQNRILSSYRSINNTKENLSAAESRIRDVDVAAETADLSRNSIMQQAAVAILSQANTQPQLALSLLSGR
ncbi:MAG: flagellin FliC [Planctomycetes bacterium]|nr:flagellin FliC [Planctomycetota bacterium]